MIDWRRDFSHNVAETTTAARDPLLRPLVVPMPLVEAAEIVRHGVAELARWEIAEARIDTTRAVLACVRVTRWLRFRDDITIEIQPVEGGSRVTATSRSRVGKGDLGQNPRNLRELMRALKRRIAKIEHAR